MVNVNPNERLVIIEDTGEIQCKAINHVQFHTTNKVSMTDLLKTTLRMRPDRILVGEVRGSEALDLLMAWQYWDMKADVQHCMLIMQELV